MSVLAGASEGHGARPNVPVSPGSRPVWTTWSASQGIFEIIFPVAVSRAVIMEVFGVVGERGKRAVPWL